MEAALRRQHDAAGGIAVSQRRMICAIAGDIKGIETLAGHAGPSGKYNCVMCAAVLHETYQAGVPHLRVLPEPWISADKRPPHIINPPARGGTEQMAEQARLYAADSAACAPKELSSGLDKYKSCVQAPLFYSNDLAEHTTCTPLHVSLGLGTNYMKAVEHRCAQLDMAWALNVSDDAAIVRRLRRSRRGQLPRLPSSSQSRNRRRGKRSSRVSKLAWRSSLARIRRRRA